MSTQQMPSQVQPAVLTLQGELLLKKIMQIMFFIYLGGL